jgi:hypothetical protein
VKAKERKNTTTKTLIHLMKDKRIGREKNKQIRECITKHLVMCYDINAVEPQRRFSDFLYNKQTRYPTQELLDIKRGKWPV